MPVALERELKRRAKKKDIEDKDAYVYGTLRKTGWKPKRERKMSAGGMVPGDSPGSSAILSVKLDHLIEFAFNPGDFPMADAKLAAALERHGLHGAAKRLGLPTSGYVSAPSSQVTAAVSPRVPSPHPYVKPAPLPGHVVSPDTLNIPEPPAINRIALLNQLHGIRQRNAVRQAAFRKQQLLKRPSSWDPDRSLISGSFSARLDRLLEFKAIDLGRTYGGIEAYPSDPIGKPEKHYPSLYIGDRDDELDLPLTGTAKVKYKLARKSMNQDGDGKKRHSADIEIHSIEPMEENEKPKEGQKAKLLSARLDQLLEFADPRPRNPLGEFSGSSEGVPDPNTMVKTYAQKATDAAVGGAAGAVGGATAGAGGAALKKILEMVKKRKAKI